MDVLTYPNKQLYAPLMALINPATKEELVNKMIHVMYMKKAMGLAANQIGRNESIFVADVDGNPLVAINPSIIIYDEEKEKAEEACLSIPGVFADVFRYRHVELEYTDMEGNRINLKATDTLARVFQHETDHLHGVLYWDYLSQLKRDMLKRKYLKEQKRRRV